MARPRLKIDPSTVEKLASIGCTVAEIAAFIGCHKKTLERRFVAVIEKGREGMKLSVRRMQYETANKGNCTMQIWLGKQYLGQKDKQELTGKDGKELFEIIIGNGKDKNTDS